MLAMPQVPPTCKVGAFPSDGQMEFMKKTILVLEQLKKEFFQQQKKAV